MVSLGVMSDALLSPQQGVIARAWTQHLRDLARAVGVALPSPRAQSPSTSPSFSLGAEDQQDYHHHEQQDHHHELQGHHYDQQDHLHHQQDHHYQQQQSLNCPE